MAQQIQVNNQMQFLTMPRRPLPCTRYIGTLKSSVVEFVCHAVWWLTVRRGLASIVARSALVIHRTAALDHHSRCTRPFSGKDIGLGQLRLLFRPPQAKNELAELPHTI
jgi:hypothetical protein